MPVVHVSRSVVADPHGVVLVLTTGDVVELWPGVRELRSEDAVHHVTAELPELGSTRMRIAVTAPVRSADSFLIGFVISGDLPPVAGALRVAPAPDGAADITTLSLSIDHGRDIPSLPALAQRFLDAIADRVEDRALDE